MREFVVIDAPLKVRREQLADRSTANVVCRQADWQRAERVGLMRDRSPAECLVHDGCAAILTDLRAPALTPRPWRDGRMERA
jgi:hypothetical protein